MKILIPLLLLPTILLALTNDETTTSDYTKKDFMGLCTDHNKNEKYYARGVCDSLSQALETKQCTKGQGKDDGNGDDAGKSFDKMIEEIRLRYQNKFNGPPEKNADGTPKDTGMTLGSDCGAWGDAVKDPGKFRSLMKQFLMSIAIQESKLNPLANIQNQPGTDTNPDEPRGFWKVKTSDMNKPEYKCGCTNINVDGNDGPQRRPGSRDEHEAVCVAYMALYHILNDRTLFGGDKPETGKPVTDSNKPKGAAVIWPSLMSHGTEPDPTADPPGSKYREKNPQLRALNEKMGFYCEKLRNPDGTLRDFDNREQPIR